MAAARRCVLRLTQTIVECLKYAATGDLPPNTKGGGFVHDPMLSHTDSVKAQVRLRFRNTGGTRMSCVRNVQVTKKKGGGLTMKTLEGVLGVDDENVASSSRAAISTRCAELDTEMSVLLGVSRAILENVLFCHQEDSSWPLSEPAVLKKRFDEIFEVTRYTKALDTVRALRKQRLQDARVDEAELRGLQQDKERAESIQSKIRALTASLEHKTRERDELDALIQQQVARHQRLYDDATRFREVVGHAETLEERLAMYMEREAELQARLEPLDVDDDELQRRIEALPDEVEAQRKRLADVQAHMDEILAARERCTRDYDELLARHAALDAADQAFQRLCRESADELRSAGADVAGVSAAALEAAATARLAALSDEGRRLAAAGRDAAQAEEAEEARRERALQDAQEQWRSAQTRYDQVHETWQRVQRRLAECAAQLSAEVPDTDASALERAREALAALPDDDPAALDDALQALARLAAERDAMTETLAMAARDAETRAARGQLDALLLDKQRVLDDLTRHLEAQCRRRWGATPPSLDDAVAQSQQALSSATQALRDAEHDVERVRASLRECEATLAARRDDDTRCAADMESLLGGFESADEGVRTAEDEVQAVRESLGLLEHAAAFFARIQKHGHEHHVCLACHQPLSADAMPAFDAHMAASMQRSTPERREALHAELDAWTQQLARLQAAQALETQRRAMAKDVAALEKTCATYRTQCADAEARRDDALQAHASAEAEAVAVRAWQDDAAQCARARADVEQLEQRVAALPPLGRASADASPARLSAVQAAWQAQHSRCEELRTARERQREQRVAAERTVHALELERAERQQRDAAAAVLRQRHDELAADAADLGTQRSAALAARERAQAPLDDATTALAHARAARREAEAARREAADAHAQQLGGVRAVQERVRDAAARHERGALETCAASLAAARTALHEARGAADAATRDVHALEAALRDVQGREAALQDQQRLRRLAVDMASVRAELGALDLDAAHARHEHATAAYDAARREESELSGRAAHLRGELAGIEAELARRRAELRDEYRDVDERYVQQLVHIKVAGMANRDLETYAGALHQAILQFHAIKMEEVNQTLDYLWKKTYQGTDIDTVRIRSDAEGRLAASGLRSYQYRVCMVKDHVELDMRGRCSAGQKVLACLLIRLALADSFGAQCGFLALDEPTTNLDRENVEALAASLVDLIAERRHQRNFQLIVITHDEEFLTQLTQSDALSQYWRVSRDEHLHSVISREVVRSM